MAADVYLQIEGIKGESRDAGHREWMECQYVDWGVSQPKSATTSSSGHTVGRCHHQTIMIARLSDLATPILLQTCAMGKTLPRAKIELMRADGQGQPIRYFEVELENMLIAEIYPEVSEGQPMIEYLALAFSKIKWRYAQQKIGGGIAGLTAGGWDLAQNRLLA
jgi:type VI secretion system secreted protein Hcp